uniref:Low molecular weight glutenin subunit n=1 Tax=Brachypodium distachyon TaxID=15368 RepID=F1C958_BRADI|nr:low molecular weight glutenin subunit [Brachypodium distachyon]
MKNFLVFTLLAVVATSTIAQMETSCIPGLERPWQQQPLPPQQSFSQQPPFPQQQQPLPQQPSISQQQPPFLQQQGPPFSQQQRPVLPQQSPFSQQQQLVLPPQQQQQLVQQQIPIVQPSILQQLNPCKVFLQQQCSPIGMPQRLARSQMWQQSSCHVMQQQYCQQLQQIPEQSRYEAIRAIIFSIILQEQQQGFVQPQQQQPQQSGQSVSQSQQQSRQQLGQCSFQQPQQQLGQQPQQQQVQKGTFLQPHQIARLEVMTSITLRTLPTMCSVNVPSYSSITSAPLGVGSRVGAY